MRTANASPAMLAVSIAVAAMAVIVPSGGAAAQDTGGAERLLIAEGQALAERWCASCHAIGTRSQSAALSDAPSFRLLAEEPYLDAGVLLARRTTPHPVMPPFPLTGRSAEALAAYIRSVRPETSEEAVDPTGQEGSVRP